MLALLGIGQRLLHGRLRHADRPRRSLNARRLERLHQLPEAQPLDAAEQILSLHLETVERDLVFFHPAIAEDLDFGARNACGRKWIIIGAARLFRQQHGESAVAAFARIGAHEQRHQISAYRVRDPSLVAVDFVDVSVSDRPRSD